MVVLPLKYQLINKIIYSYIPISFVQFINVQFISIPFTKSI